MCFSANVSFAAAAVLAVVGTASVMSPASPARRLFAATPLLFAAQQAAEGVVWMTMGDNQGSIIHHLAVNSFLFVALAVWPLWLPWSLEGIEMNLQRRRMLRVLGFFGGSVSAVSVLLLIRMRPETSIVGHSLHYEFAGTNSAVLSSLMLAAYLIPTVLPLFASTTTYARRIGFMLVLSVVAATYVQREALTSVWCFFSALLSGAILFAIRATEPVMLRVPRHG